MSKEFPRPKLILSDRAQVFLCAALKVWNNEKMNQFLDRSYRIVNGDATDEDLRLTNIHACMAHVLVVNLFIDILRIFFYIGCPSHYQQVYY